MAIMGTLECFAWKVAPNDTQMTQTHAVHILYQCSECGARSMVLDQSTGVLIFDSHGCLIRRGPVD